MIILSLLVFAIIISSIRIESYPEEIVKYKDSNIKGFLKLAPDNIQSIKIVYHRKLALDQDELITHFIWSALIVCFVALIICLILSIIPYYKLHIKTLIFNKGFIGKILGRENSMNAKNFLQIAALVILAGIVFYIVYPKYYLKMPFKINKITGKTYKFDVSQQKWTQER